MKTDSHFYALVSTSLDRVIYGKNHWLKLCCEVKLSKQWAFSMLKLRCGTKPLLEVHCICKRLDDDYL